MTLKNLQTPSLRVPPTGPFPVKNISVHKSRSRSNERNTVNLVVPLPAASKPKRQEFLNVDSNENQAILTMIAPFAANFDFNSFSRYVVGASDLTNRELFVTLYAHSALVPLKHSELIELAKSENKSYCQTQQLKRSRNPVLPTAGQSVNTLDDSLNKVVCAP